MGYESLVYLAVKPTISETTLTEIKDYIRENDQVYSFDESTKWYSMPTDVEVLSKRFSTIEFLFIWIGEDSNDNSLFVMKNGDIKTKSKKFLTDSTITYKELKTLIKFHKMEDSDDIDDLMGDLMYQNRIANMNKEIKGLGYCRIKIEEE